MNNQFISYDKEADHFYVWEATFGTWDHQILSQARTLPELQIEYPFAIIGARAQEVWDRRLEQKVSA